MRLSRDEEAGNSPLVLFGDELKYWRLAAGLSQEQLGDLIGYSGAQVGAVENGRRMPRMDLAQNCDKVLNTSAALVRQLERVKKFLRTQAYPAWFRGWANVEREATTLRNWEPLLVPGLLQTEDYARTILGVQPGTTAEWREDQVKTRMARQAALDGEGPPFLWCLIDEGVLYRRIGTAKIMHTQLEHLITMSERPNVTVQVVPYSVGEHPGTAGPFVIAGFDDAPGIVYLDTAVTGQLVETQSMVDQVTLMWEALRSEALPRTASRDLIAKIAEEKWT